MSVSEDVVEGLICMSCHQLVDGTAPGHPRFCGEGCQHEAQPKRRKKQPKQPRCETCGRHFRNVTGMKMHVDAVHGGKKDQWLCVACGRTFPTQYGLMQHVVSDSPMRECSTCGKRFVSHKALKDHAEATGHCFAVKRNAEAGE